MTRADHSEATHTGLTRSTSESVVTRTLTLPPLVRYGVAIAAVALTVALGLLRLWLNPKWGVEFSFIQFMPAIIFSGWVGGAGPGILATMLCAVAAQYWLLPPQGSWVVNDKSELLGLVLLVLVGVITSGLNEAWRRTLGALGRTERVLRARTEELERVMDVIPTAVWIAKDRDCREIVGNHSAAELLGTPLGQNVSQTRAPGEQAVLLRHFRAGRELSPNELPLQQAAATARAQAPQELEIELAAGRRVTVIGGAAPLLDEQGQVRGAVAALTDVSELIDARRALEAADRQKDEFLALLAHELRNPLSPISTASELLCRTLSPDSRARTAVEIIKRQTTHLTRLVDDLLDIARITQGRIHLQRMPVLLADVVAQALETVEPRMREKHHEVSILGSDIPLYVHGDLARLVQCLGNVIANAAKYTEPHGKIRIEPRAEGDTVILSVQDNGVGITSDLLPTVFDLFVQGRQTLNRSEGGLGIGLSVVKRLVHMHGGQVTAHSAGPGTGTRIEIRLPRIDPPRKPEVEPVCSSVSTRRVLIIDDNVDAAASLAMLLDAAGHETVVAHGPEQALETMKQFRPDVALVDIGLPRISGYDLARRWRADPLLKDVALIALTGYGQATDKQQAHAAGFDRHLVKPVDLAVLERILAEPLGETASGVLGEVRPGQATRWRA